LRQLLKLSRLGVEGREDVAAVLRVKGREAFRALDLLAGAAFPDGELLLALVAEGHNHSAELPDLIESQDEQLALDADEGVLDEAEELTFLLRKQATQLRGMAVAGLLELEELQLLSLQVGAQLFQMPLEARKLDAEIL